MKMADKKLFVVNTENSNFTSDMSFPMSIQRITKPWKSILGNLQQR